MIGGRPLGDLQGVVRICGVDLRRGLIAKKGGVLPQKIPGGGVGGGAIAGGNDEAVSIDSKADAIAAPFARKLAGKLLAKLLRANPDPEAIDGIKERSLFIGKEGADFFGEFVGFLLPELNLLLLHDHALAAGCSQSQDPEQESRGEDGQDEHEREFLQAEWSVPEGRAVGNRGGAATADPFGWLDCNSRNGSPCAGRC